MADFPATSRDEVIKILAPSATHGVTLLNSNGAFLARASAAWPAADLAVLVPVLVPSPFTVTKLGIENGTGVSGNVDVGIYTAEGNLVISSGSTVQAGTSAWQTFDVTDTLLQPGVYYLAAVLNNGTGTVSRGNYGAQILRTCGILQMATAFPLPATATYAAMAQAYFPYLMATSTVTV